MKIPLDLCRGPTPEDEVQYTNPEDYPTWLKDMLQTIHQDVRKFAKKIAIKMKERYDKTTTTTTFQPGDLVWLYNPRRYIGVNPKLLAKWDGPYTIIKIINNCVAQIQRVQSETKKRKGGLKIVHLDRLASYTPSQEEDKSAWCCFYC